MLVGAVTKQDICIVASAVVPLKNTVGDKPDFHNSGWRFTHIVLIVSMQISGLIMPLTQTTLTAPDYHVILPHADTLAQDERWTAPLSSISRQPISVR